MSENYFGVNILYKIIKRQERWQNCLPPCFLWAEMPGVFAQKKEARNAPPEIALKYPPVPYRVNNNPLLKAGGCLAQRI